MKRLLVLLLKTAIVLLLLPLFVAFGIIIYAMYVNPDAEQTMKDMTEFLEAKQLPGNGFGGVEGAVVLDSRLKSSKRYFWVDNENLLFRLDFNARSEKDGQRNYVWNTREDSIKPLEVDGPVICFLRDKLYYAKPAEARTLPNGNIKGQVYQSNLKEMSDKWVVASSRKIESIWRGPSEEYDLYWSDDCYPYLVEASGDRSRKRSPSYSLSYASEWGWAMRLPTVWPANPAHGIPEVGIYDLEGEAYSGQTGRKVVEFPQMLLEEAPHLHLAYIGFLDKYLLANKPYNDPGRNKFLELVSRDGEFQHLAVLDDWPTYTGMPLPTRKGVIWSGKDYRYKNPSREDIGTFLKDGLGRVFRVGKGVSLSGEMSNDGCSIAFFNSPEYGRRNGTLKVFKVCNSKFNGKELQDVDY